MRAGRIAGAGLDVRPWTLSPGKARYGTAQHHHTPHYHRVGEKLSDAVVDFWCENLRRFAENQPLLGVVDRRAGYRDHSDAHHWPDRERSVHRCASGVMGWGTGNSIRYPNPPGREMPARAGAPAPAPGRLGVVESISSPRFVSGPLRHED